MKVKQKGYRVERKVRILFEKNGWKVIRAGASFGEADLVCIKNRKVVFLQVKSTKKPNFYYYGFNESMMEGYPYYLVIDFGYGNVRILPPKSKVNENEGTKLDDFLLKTK
jgi:Holliday junction resolvase